MTTDLILTRDATSPPPPLGIPSDLVLHQVTNIGEAGFAFLDQIYSMDGFPPGWAAQMLGRGSVAVVIVSGQTPAASALLVRKPFYVREILRTFDAGAEGDYYFGDYVAPAFRGRQIQRMLIRARLHISQQAGRRWAHALTRTTIPASAENYLAEGFCTAAKLHARRWAGWRWEHHEVVDPRLSAGSLSDQGLRLPCSRWLCRGE